MKRQPKIGQKVLLRIWLEGPKGNDRDQVKAVVGGEGDIAIVNTYYIGKLLNSKDPRRSKSRSRSWDFLSKSGE